MKRGRPGGGPLGCSSPAVSYFAADCEHSFLEFATFCIFSTTVFWLFLRRFSPIVFVPPSCVVVPTLSAVPCAASTVVTLPLLPLLPLTYSLPLPLLSLPPDGVFPALPLLCLCPQFFRQLAASAPPSVFHRLAATPPCDRLLIHRII
ncbi:hypothetical protein niasHT_001737 [Heterodera trifolii]|uniref:Uncharacterized protein n=1 Tax=Heterodera trifolii TaxID=157864 RepID=A0ABD2MEY5_9BILA